MNNNVKPWYQRAFGSIADIVLVLGAIAVVACAAGIVSVLPGLFWAAVGAGVAALFEWDILRTAQICGVVGFVLVFLVNCLKALSGALE